MFGLQCQVFARIRSIRKPHKTLRVSASSPVPRPRYELFEHTFNQLLGLVKTRTPVLSLYFSASKVVTKLQKKDYKPPDKSPIFVWFRCFFFFFWISWMLTVCFIRSLQPGGALDMCISDDGIGRDKVCQLYCAMLYWAFIGGFNARRILSFMQTLGC